MSSKLPLLVLFVLSLSFNSVNSQNYDRGDEEAVGFFVAQGGLLSTQFNSNGELYAGSNRTLGYQIGIAYYLTNEINYDEFFVRFALDYSQETAEAGEFISYQNIPVISKGDFPFLGLSIFGAYRFDPKSAINGYIGGGIFIQQRLNSVDDSFIFETADGEQFPIFQPDNFDAPLRFRRDGPTGTILGFNAEFGSFVWVGKRWLTIGLGIDYGFFPKISAKQKLSKSNLYLKLGYEIL